MAKLVMVASYKIAFVAVAYFKAPIFLLQPVYYPPHVRRPVSLLCSGPLSINTSIVVYQARCQKWQAAPVGWSFAVAFKTVVPVALTASA